MTLATQYSIAVKHQRSTRIDSDLSADFFPSLVYHGTAQSALETLARQYSQANQRAYTLTGPYGSGKSTIALLLLGLLNHDVQLREAATDVLNTESKRTIAESISYDKGWLQIRAVGGVSSPVQTFWKATLTALREHPNTQGALTKYVELTPETDAELLDHWESLFAEIKPHVDGILLIADEMGKTLEFINKNKGELHLFQDIAEILGRIQTPTIFLGLLHQAFGEYAKDRGTKLQKEWAKIQGRYTDILYNVSSDETVSLIAKSIVNTEVSQQTVEDPFVSMTLAAFNEGNEDRKKILEQRLRDCAPLHPLTALLLGPLSKRRFSQNERSTFGFLCSHEANSFQLFLQRTIDKDARYGLHHLWDYLETNLEHAILGSPDGHAWAEASEAIARVDVEDSTLKLLKTIALLNLFGKPACLYATNKILKAASGITDSEELQEHLNRLKENSCIIFRKHQSAWAVFEGSDLDIPSLLEQKIEQLANSDEAIDYITYSQQIMAKGHYHTKGTLRWAEQSIALHFNALDIKAIQVKRKGEFANFILLIGDASQEEKESFTAEHTSIALAYAINAQEIMAYAKEMYALDLLKADKDIGGQLQHDRVAQKEYDSRLSDAQRMLWVSIEEAFTHSQWYIRGEKKNLEPLSQLASDLADDLYLKSPQILNELVNRNKLSGTAVSARKKLLEAMLEHADEENLGITGFPPEMSMYISCLRKTKLHYFNGNKWVWSANNATPFKELFKATTDFLSTHSGEMINLATITHLWTEQPYGLTQGIVPIIILAYLKSLGQDIAFYENDLSGEFAFIAEPDLDYILKLQKNPKDLAIKFVVLDDKDKEWLEFLSRYASKLTTQPVQANLLAVSRPLVTSTHNLPYWVKNASKLVSDNKAFNKQILTIRDTLLHANDPHALIIEDLTRLLDPNSELSYKAQIDVLERCMNVLKQAHEEMLSNINTQINAIFPQTGEELLAMCNIVESHAGDLRLKAFARELGRSQNFGLKWLESLMSVVIGRGMQNWNETNILSAKQKISEYSQDFLRIVKSSNGIKKINQLEHSLKTKTISLILENSDGELINYQKEIRISDDTRITPAIKEIKNSLDTLSEFEQIDLLQRLLKETLIAQG